MRNSIKIISGKSGWYLRVNGFYIHAGYDAFDRIIAIECDFPGPDGTTEWVSVQALRKFWTENMWHIVGSTQRPYKSVSGNLIPV